MNMVQRGSRAITPRPPRHKFATASQPARSTVYIRHQAKHLWTVWDQPPFLLLQSQTLLNTLLTQVCFVTTIVIVRPSPSYGIYEDSLSALIHQVFNPTFETDLHSSFSSLEPSWTLSLFRCVLWRRLWSWDRRQATVSTRTSTHRSYPRSLILRLRQQQACFPLSFEGTY